MSQCSATLAPGACTVRAHVRRGCPGPASRRECFCRGDAAFTGVCGDMINSKTLHCACLFGLALVSSHAARADVWINEFHYDNSGTDTNEKIEVMAPAGTAFTGWKVVLYNGSGGLQYATLNLAGTAADQCGGHGTTVATVGTTGMQNGAPDGFALVNPSNQVVQFLSYEGSFAATDGPEIGRAHV